MRSLRGLVVCEDPELRARIEEYLLQPGEVEATLVLERYPERREAARHLNLSRPEVILLAIDRLQAVVEFLQELEITAPGVPVIGISRLQDPRALAELMRLGIRDCVAVPLNRVRFQEAIHRIAYEFKEAALRTPSDPVVCFLPARGGSGTSTLACNVSYRMSELSGAHVLLADLDLPAGLSRFVFQLNPTSSLGELIESGNVLGLENWRQCVVSAARLHILNGGHVNPRRPFTAHHMRRLMDFASAQYTAVCVDLSGSMEIYALELLRRSRLILLVSTTEGPSIELAREKLQFLTLMELHSRTRVALTLHPGARAPDVAGLKTYLGAPIDAVFGFAEKQVRRCLADGSLINGKTALGRQIEQFSRELNDRLAAPPKAVDTLRM